VCAVSNTTDLRGLPSRECGNCGSDLMKVVVQLDEDNNIAAYSLNGYCYSCESAITIPTPVEESLA
jgi:hypothetical protein